MWRWAERPTGRSERLRCLSALDQNEVWAAGSGGLVLCTVDGGRSWRDVSPNGCENLQLRSLVVFDPQNAAVLGAGSGDGARVLRTVDGGVTWAETYRPVDDRSFLNCMAFGPGGVGIALADPVEGVFRIAHSSDAAQTWTEIRPRWMPPAWTGETSFAASGTALIAVGGEFWFTTGGARRARVFTSVEAGQGWRVAETPFRAAQDAGLFSVAVNPHSEAVAVGGDYHRQSNTLGEVVRSSDGGSTWRAIPGARLTYRSSVVWSTAGFVAVGAGCSDLSQDGGRTWTALAGTAHHDALGVAADGSVWAVGQDGRVSMLEFGPDSEASPLGG